MKKMLLVVGIFTVLLMGCGKTDIVKTYEKTDNNEIMRTYYQMNDGTWKCDDIIYKYRLELSGRTPTADSDGCYVVLTDNKSLTFEDVAKSLFSSSFEDSKIMENSVIVEMK